jgi:hypothetical protein
LLKFRPFACRETGEFGECAAFPKNQIIRFRKQLWLTHNMEAVRVLQMGRTGEKGPESRRLWRVGSRNSEGWDGPPYFCSFFVPRLRT